MARFPIPGLAGDYTPVYKPERDRYRGPDGVELRSGRWYDEWVPNDHAFVRNRDGSWHLFGITHPLTSPENIHEGEVQLFHAVAAEGFPPSPRMAADKAAPVFAHRGNILPPPERPGEPEFIHSPFFIEKNGRFHMFYGPQSFRMAVSEDLLHWELRGEVFRDCSGNSRDPHILEHDGAYHLSYCSGHEVRMSVSPDLAHWEKPRVLLSLPSDLCPESPVLLRKDGVFYLFVCLWDGNWNERDISQAYQHKTLVFAASRLEDFSRAEPLAEIDSHAPEIVEVEGEYYLSSVEWPARGVHVARLEWR